MLLPKAGVLASGDTLNVAASPDEQQFYYLYDFTTILPDTHGTLSVRDIKKPERQTQFVPYHKEIMRETPGISKYWHQVSIQNNLSTSIDVWFYSGATHTLLYDDSGEADFTVYAGGRNIPYTAGKKYLPRSLYPHRQLIPVHLDSNEIKTLYFQSTFPDFWKRYSTSLAGYLVNDNYLQQREIITRGENYSFAFVMGIIVAITVFLLIFYSIYREPAFFALALLALTSLLWYLYTKGLLFTTLLASTSSKTGTYEVGEYILVAVRAIAFYYYVIVFLSLKIVAPRWYRLFKWATVVLVGIIVTDFLLRFFIVPQQFQIHILGWQMVNGGISLMLIPYLAVGIHLTVKKVPMAGIYLLGNIFNVTGLVLHTLSMNFISGPFLATIDQWGTALMLVTFALALAFRMRSIEAEKKLAETEVIQIDADLKAAAELDTMKTSFFTSISHEFRTPLTLIMSPLEKLRDENTQTKSRERLDLILRNARRMQNLINQLLDLAKVQSSKAILSVSEHNFVEHIRTIAAAHESLAESKGIQFQVRLPDDELTLYYDREMMNKIVNNLMSNAFKYCTNDGEVILWVKKLSDNVELKVENSGEPIAHEDQDRIFNHFQRLESTHHQIEGSGIGLSLVKDYVKLHQGEISVRSEPDENICFTATFLLGDGHFAPEQMTEEAEEQTTGDDDSTHVSERIGRNEHESRPDTEQPLVLIVEDNHDMRQFITEELEDIYTVNVAVNGKLGLEAARESVPDLIISDVMMPELDGFGFLEKSRQDPLLCHIPIIMLTALSTDEAKFKGLETGADDYLLKPFNTRELRIRVANLIRQRERLRERFTLDQAQDLKQVTVSSMDEKFLRGIMDSIEIHMADLEFGVKELSEEVFMSRSQLFRKLTALTNLSPTDFIRTQRLKRAANLLEQHVATVTEIAYMVGFQNPAHFATSFKKQYGVSPSKYSPSS
ncbi:MAG: response regulator [Candidatus Marinimicrobia bacterium]|nr:response regulator [Candidatus Neomarinimicrobiota bacterium]MBT3576402.1 response regulator [Candidatus Neomarinimicrobiota bacterium]MBT3680100.1 response regulator [Candidatus Neomarinimicrobiota bacterium]MBT3950085.1 response regulator [Candidatus Neomarinimicrobiota bacterium]MBT4254384.1 response regulator [Candidatus Neomarinimicrobiota bacterium]